MGNSPHTSAEQNGLVAAESRAMGLNKKHKNLFAVNAKDIVQSSLLRWGVHDIKLVQGDIATISTEIIPHRISVCLLDVDLSIPIYVGLKRIFSNLIEGGLILIDDCRSDTAWIGAIKGYKDFVEEYGLEERYFMGFGVVEKRSKKNGIDWDFHDKPNPCSRKVVKDGTRKRVGTETHTRSNRCLSSG